MARLHGLTRRARWRGCRRVSLFLLAALFVLSLLAAARVAPWRRPVAQLTWPGSSSPPRPVTRFTIGAFLQNRTPRNSSFCVFPLGWGDNFTIPDDVIAGSPELGDKGPHRAVYNAVLGHGFNDSRGAVTFVTHATVEFMVHIAEIARAWDGPVSVACYLPGADASRAFWVLQTLCACEPAMLNVSVHLVFHMHHPPNATATSENVVDSCSVPPLWLESGRAALSLPYPVNVARNVARVGARTDWLLVADIELFPSSGLAQGFLDMVQRLVHRRAGDYSFLKKRHVFVVPVFEVVADVRRLPRTKRELLNLHAAERAVYFHRFVCLHCQRFPGLQQWLQRRDNPRNKPHKVQPMLVVKREFPNHRWEPVYIGTQKEPLYSELLTWEGQQDKMAQMYEMCLLDYRFVILDGVFLVHTPGVKHRKTPDNKTGNCTLAPTQRSQQVRRNSYLYTLITQDLTSKYRENLRCKRQ